MTVIHLLPLAIYRRHVQDLERRGTGFVGTCPLPGCQEHQFMINHLEGLFYCFACGRGGNLDDFRRALGVAA